jgi:hypothetical protein
MKQSILVLMFLLAVISAQAQPIPAADENIPFLVTFGKQSNVSWGDNNFSQVFFVAVPVNEVKPFYIRVFDPEVSGSFDEVKGDFNTTTTYTVIGGKECISNHDARNIDPKGNYKCGTQLASKTFINDAKFDGQWYTFGPFNPKEGELAPEYGGYIFKIIAEGVSGDDGNLYRYFVSTSGKENIPVEGTNCFTFQYTFRLSDNPSDVSHLYPFVDNKVVAVKISDFDHDNDGVIRIVSHARKGEFAKISGDNEWSYTEHPITDKEKNSSLDIQFIKNRNNPAKNNNITIYITNQYNELLPFYVIPIGGVPKYRYEIGVKAVSDKK